MLSFQSSKVSKDQAKKDNLIAQFRQVTGASQADAVKYLKKHGYRIESALNELYNDPAALSAITGQQSKEPNGKKLAELFDKYKEEGEENITVSGTMAFCEDIGLDLEDVVLLAVSHELKSPQMGVFTRSGWIEGWKSLKCDSLESIQASLPKLRGRLSNDAAFFKRVYLYAFDFVKSPGQRSIPIDNAKAFWSLLLPAGLAGDALKHEGSGEGWREEYNQWWFDFLDAKGGKGVSRDSWNMFLDFVRAIDSKFESYDEEAAWPSLIDEFVESSRERLSATS